MLREHTSLFDSSARYAALRRGLTAVPVIQGIAAVETTTIFLLQVAVLSDECCMGASQQGMLHRLPGQTYLPSS